MRKLRGGEWFQRPEASGTDDDQLAGLHVAHVGGSDQVQRARFRAHDERVAQTAEGQRPEPVRVSHGNHPVRRQHEERERPLQLRHRFDDRILGTTCLGPRVEVLDDFRVAAGLEDRTLTDELVAEVVRVCEVAVVADAELAVRAIDQEGLCVRKPALPSGRIADVPDRRVPRQLRQRLPVEDVGHVAHRLVDTDERTVRGRNARALLSPVLQRVQAEIGHVRGLGVSENSEDAALVLELVQHVRPLF